MKASGTWLLSGYPHFKGTVSKALKEFQYRNRRTEDVCKTSSDWLLSPGCRDGASIPDADWLPSRL